MKIVKTKYKKKIKSFSLRNEDFMKHCTCIAKKAGIHNVHFVFRIVAENGQVIMQNEHYYECLCAIDNLKELGARTDDLCISLVATDYTKPKCITIVDNIEY